MSDNENEQPTPPTAEELERIAAEALQAQMHAARLRQITQDECLAGGTDEEVFMRVKERINAFRPTPDADIMASIQNHPSRA